MLLLLLPQLALAYTAPFEVDSTHDSTEPGTPPNSFLETRGGLKGNGGKPLIEPHAPAQVHADLERDLEVEDECKMVKELEDAMLVCGPPNDGLPHPGPTLPFAYCIVRFRGKPGNEADGTGVQGYVAGSAARMQMVGTKFKLMQVYYCMPEDDAFGGVNPDLTKSLHPHPGMMIDRDGRPYGPTSGVVAIRKAAEKREFFLMMDIHDLIKWPGYKARRVPIAPPRPVTRAAPYARRWDRSSCLHR